MFIVKNRGGNSTDIVSRCNDVESALIAEAMGFRVDGVGYVSVLELAKARCEESPDYNLLPEADERYAMYRSNRGNSGIYEVIRWFSPDSDGGPQMVELFSMKHDNTSFNVSVKGIKLIDIDSLPKELADALLRGPEECARENIGNAPKLTRGLKKRDA